MLRAATRVARARAGAAPATLARRHALPPPATRRENSTLIVAGLAVSAGALLARETMKLVEARAEAAKQQADAGGDKAKGDGAASSGGGFAAMFDSFGKRHYDGPFEAPMTRREAALILGGDAAWHYLCVA